MQIFFGHCYRPKLSLNTLVLILGSLVCTDIANTTWAQELPSLGDGASRMVSPQLERRIGEAFLRQLHANLPISEDVLVQYFVEQHMHNLAQHAQMRGSLQSIIVVDNPEINAFAAPGGIIGINLGLLLYAQDIHEYSSVVAHEFAHISQRHFARGIEEQQAASVPMLASMIAALLVGAAGGGEAGMAALSAAQAAGQSNQLRFSRARESEADRIGLNTMRRANLDPNAMSRMFERMQSAYRFTSRPPEFLLTHPLSETRISDARNQARDFFSSDPKGASRKWPDQLEYQLVRMRTKHHFSNNAKADVFNYRERLKAQPTDPALQYSLALALSKTNEHDQALALMRGLKSKISSRIFYHASLAELLIAAQELDSAQSLLREQLALYPDNFPLAMLYAQALIADEQYISAESVLESQSKLRPQDTHVWFLLAETAGLASNVTGVHLARAEYFYLHGALHRAIQHLEYAQRLVRKSNPVLETKLAQRIQDLRTSIRMQNS
ncbi:MAG: M48 family metalloprotease [Pseudomonadota bacterium]|nr:M48 family metalloprotease [Pseudomonadota bacterium]